MTISPRSTLTAVALAVGAVALPLQAATARTHHRHLSAGVAGRHGARPPRSATTPPVAGRPRTGRPQTSRSQIAGAKARRAPALHAHRSGTAATRHRGQAGAPLAEISPVRAGAPRRAPSGTGAGWRSRKAVRDQRLEWRRRVAAHATGDPSDSIIDFAFSPASLTIHVGDTISWTNTGKAPHTATARGGAFDTGLLKTGQSASHTFTTAGTFAYFCTVHPFMHGTVVVLAKAATSTPTTPSSTTTPSTPSTTASTPSTTTPPSSTTTPPSSTPPAATASGTSLPNTGLDVGLTAAIGILMLGLGAALRRQRAARR